MTMKSIILTGALALSSVAFAGTKSYDIVLTGPVQAGSTQLKAGTYTLKMAGSFAILTNVATAKSFLTSVTIENAAQLNERTKVETTKQGNTERIVTIGLGGTNETLDFGE